MANDNVEDLISVNRQVLDELKEIKEFLLGSEYHPMGVKQRLDNMERFVKRQKNINYVIYTVSGIGVAATAFILTIKNILK